MHSVQEHYAKHLSALYVWMAGGFDAAVSRGRAELDALTVQSLNGGKAVDLGAGFGMHAIPLAERGYGVVAIDSSSLLLEELTRNCGSLPIEAIEDDLLAFPEHLHGPADLMLCMGDTLTHLPSSHAVETLAALAVKSLKSGGRFIATFRDYSIPLTDADRFIAVKGDDRRIMTCFLEYFQEHVHVHDLLQERTEAGWSLRASTYKKLRLAPAWVAGVLEAAGFVIRMDRSTSGMIRLIGQLR